MTVATPVRMDRRHFLLGTSAACAALAAAGRAWPQAQPAAPPSPARRLARLRAGVERAEALRAVKRVQHAFAHYCMAGRWSDAAGLFASDALMRGRSGDALGRDAIRAMLQASLGNEGEGLSPGQLNVVLAMSPVVDVSADGRTARGRWREVAMLGEYGARAEWAGGIYENEYVLENGVWKIAFLNYYGRFAGPYEGGWRNTPNGADLVPFHYDARGAGVSFPAPAAESEEPVTPEAVLALRARIERMQDESLIQNVQNAYGFYVDRKMWDDVADLFHAGGTMEIGAEGVYAGKESIRRGLDRFGTAGLKTGELNDRAQIQMVVTITPGGLRARARGVELGMTGVNNQSGQWSVAVFENQYVKHEGVWKISALRVFPHMAADYILGWAKDAKAPAGPSADFPPDLTPTQTVRAYPDAITVPDFSFADPGAVAAAEDSPEADGSADIETLLADAETQLQVAVAYDGSENVCNAYGYYIDEFQWDATANLFSADGWKELSYVGAYVGREPVRASLKKRYGLGGRGNPGMTLHQTIQPVITVAEDGRSARIRLRLFQMNSSPANAGSYIGGVYENETALENGVWKISGMDLDYVWLGDYATGWTQVDAAANSRFAAPASFLEELPPQRPLRGVAFAPYPEIAPMGFHYVNPVSGRAPERLLPPDGAPV